MSDSAGLLCLIPEGIPISELESFFLPAAPLDDDVHASGDFRTVYVESPLTGAIFTIEPVGELLPGKDDERRKCGAVFGYRVKVNVPACVIGHNRVLVNGVPFAARAALLLLKYWLVQNGCTREGLDCFQLENVIIEDLTLTFLECFESSRAARDALLEVRQHSEAVLNNKVSKNGAAKLNVAFSCPSDPIEADSDQTYTVYVKQREFMLTFYVKEHNQPNGTLLPIAEPAIEASVQDLHLRSLRMEPRVYAKWLKSNGLCKVKDWVNTQKPYEMLFDLIRTTLQLDKGLRSKRLKLPTVDSLELCSGDKDYLRNHLKGNSVRALADFRAMPAEQESKRYSALRKRIMQKTDGIDINIPYSVQSRAVSSTLSDSLLYRGEFKPDGQIAPYIFSRVSGPVVVEQLNLAIDNILERGEVGESKAPKYTVYRGPDWSLKEKYPGGRSVC